MIKGANRLEDIKEYYFSAKLKEVKQRNEAGENIINLGIGNPDLLPPDGVVSTLQKSAEELMANRYQSYIGTDALREEMSNWYSKHFKIALNSETEILPLLGSKEGIMHISMAFLNSGDKVLIPNPGYPAYKAASHLMGAQGIYYDLTEKNHWLPSIDQLRELPLDEVKIMWINYPNMPTGSRGSRSVIEKLIELAIENQFMIVNDNPYSFILNEDSMSILQFKGAKQCSLELNSLSKLYNMAGWRVGMVSGRQEYIAGILKVKSNMDSGMYFPIQMAAIQALRQEENGFKSLNEIYRKRRDIVWKICDKLQLTYHRKAVGLFVWAKIQNGQDSISWCEEKLNKSKVFITPGKIFGGNGEGYVRISLCSPASILEEAFHRLKNDTT